MGSVEFSVRGYEVPSELSEPSGTPRCFWRKLELLLMPLIGLLHLNGNSSAGICTSQLPLALLCLDTCFLILFCSLFPSPPIRTPLLLYSLLVWDQYFWIPIGTPSCRLALVSFIRSSSITMCTPHIHTALAIWHSSFSNCTLLVHSNKANLLAKSILVYS